MMTKIGVGGKIISQLKIDEKSKKVIAEKKIKPQGKKAGVSNVGTQN